MHKTNLFFQNLWCLRFPFCQIDLFFFQTCDVWDLPSSKLNGFGQYFMVLIRNYSVHSWHLNFSPQIASVQTLKWPSAIASRPFESLHWCNFGEKFKCHSCDGTISTRIMTLYIKIYATIKSGFRNLTWSAYPLWEEKSRILFSCTMILKHWINSIF